MSMTDSLAKDVGIKPACDALVVSRASYYRWQNQDEDSEAEGPNQVWSWDITKLKGPAKWTYYYLYVILDIFSRYVVGWMVASRELGTLAKKLIEQSCEKQGIQSSQLSIHSDRGPSMTSKPVAFLLADLGITKSLSRPNELVELCEQ